MGVFVNFDFPKLTEDQWFIVAALKYSEIQEWLRNARMCHADDVGEPSEVVSWDWLLAKIKADLNEKRNSLSDPVSYQDVLNVV